VVAGTIPCSFVVVWLTFGYQHLKTNHLALFAIAGMVAAAVGMMFAAAWSLIAPGMRRKTWLRTGVLAGGAALLSGIVGWAPIGVLGLAAAVGFLWKDPEEE
jgi:chromate transport protein ChrA